MERPVVVQRFGLQEGCQLLLKSIIDGRPMDAASVSLFLHPKMSRPGKCQNIPLHPMQVDPCNNVHTVIRSGLKRRLSRGNHLLPFMVRHSVRCPSHPLLPLAISLEVNILDFLASPLPPFPLFFRFGLVYHNLRIPNLLPRTNLPTPELGPHGRGERQTLWEPGARPGSH